LADSVARYPREKGGMISPHRQTQDRTYAETLNHQKQACAADKAFTSTHRQSERSREHKSGSGGVHVRPQPWSSATQLSRSQQVVHVTERETECRPLATTLLLTKVRCLTQWLVLCVAFPQGRQGCTARM